MWCDALPAILLTVNSAEHSANTFSPAQLILRANMCLPVDCHLPCAVLKPTLSEEQVQHLRATLAVCETVAWRYVSTPALQAENTPQAI